MTNPPGDVTITPDARSHATVSDIPLRETSTVRLVFRPEMIENSSNPRACVRGTFLYQRKRGADQWLDEKTLSLASLKSGEGYKLEIRSGELFHLLQNLGGLIRRHARHGLPKAAINLVKMEQGLADLLTLDKADLTTLLEGNRTGAMEMVRRVLKWVAANAPDAADRLPDLSLSVSVAALREALAFWTEHCNNGDEEFWQKCIEQRVFLLSQLFNYPIVILRGKAYVGGKRYDNQHGNVVDFLGKARTTGAALIVEIKTPTTPLLGREYRQDVYPMSAAVNGAISQVLHYKSSLQQEVVTVRDGLDGQMTADDPRCVVIAGNVQRELTTPAMSRSFEQLRQRVLGINIIGFDELFMRAEELIALLTEARRQP